MTKRPRRNHSPAFKAKVAVAAIRGEKTFIELAQDFVVHRNQFKPWGNQLLEAASGVFGQAPKADPDSEIKFKTLHAKITEVPDENDLSGALGPRRVCWRAQGNDLSDGQTQRQPSSGCSEDQPGQFV
jgi:transposase